MGTYTPLGFAIVGEVPEPWLESWDDFDGDDLSLAGFTATVKLTLPDGSQVTRAASVDSGTSTTTVTWQASDYAADGVLAGEVVVTDGINTYKRSFQRAVLPPRGGV